MYKKKFEFYDTRSGSCWGWSRTLGNWEVIKDTILFKWQSSWRESSDTIIGIRDSTNKKFELTFIYDNGIAIPNVEVSLSCLFENNPPTYLTDAKGKATIFPNKALDNHKKMCPDTKRMLSFSIKNEILGLASNNSLDHFVDSLDNVITVIIKRNPKTTLKTETKKYLIRNDTLIDIDPKENENYNWGNFQFTSKTFARY